MQLANLMSRLETLCRLTVIACVAFGGAIQAQTFYGSIIGTVTDPTGSSVPGATVTLINTATSQSRATQSGQDGHYEFVNLIPGNYNVQVEKAGFKRVEKNNVEIQVQAAVRGWTRRWGSW